MKIKTLKMYSYITLTLSVLSVVMGIKCVMEPIAISKDTHMKVENIPLSDEELDKLLNVGVAEILDYDLNKKQIEQYKEYFLQKEKEENKTSTAWKIRCTGYCDHGYTKSGEWTRDGIIAGKEEWLGKTAKLYKVNNDGTMGNFIGEYKFIDTGYGIDGSLIDGTSIDIWHSTEDEVWNWASTYGDYVYIEII